MSKHQFKKFERSRTAPRFRLGENDLAILKDLAAYRFLDTRQIIELHPNITARTLRSRLQLLFHAGFVERPIGQVAYYEHPHLVYTLAKKGAALVSQNGGLPNPPKPAKELGVSFMRHSLMISNFAAVLKLALKNASAELAVWRELGPIDAVQCEGERLPIAPDAFLPSKQKIFNALFPGSRPFDNDQRTAA